MATNTYDVYGIGNALVDILVEVDDSLLKELNLTKCQSHIVGHEHAKAVLDRIKYAKAKICAGGSVPNTIAGVAMLGGKTALFSKIGNDEYGYFYEKETTAVGVASKMKKCDHLTGYCIVFITPDAERTFVVHYGAAAQITKEEINEDDIKTSAAIHIESYQFDHPQTKPVCLHVMELAKKHDKMISIDLSDSGVVRRNKEELKNIIRNYGDVVFANEQEAKELTGKGPEEAVSELAGWCDIAIVKMGANGSLIQNKNQTIKINAIKANVIDTTGAGDAYAAGFLYGFTKGMALEECGNLGSKLASKVVSQIGARLAPDIIKNF